MRLTQGRDVLLFNRLFIGIGHQYFQGLFQESGFAHNAFHHEPRGFTATKAGYVGAIHNTSIGALHRALHHLRLNFNL